MCVNGWESEDPFSVNSYESEYPNSETQRLVQNVILKLEKINIVFVKLVMVKHP